MRPAFQAPLLKTQYMLSLRLHVLALITLISGAALAGNLTVNLSPSAAATAGAQWRVDAGAWRNSGVTVKNLSNAAHPVEYKAVTGWIAPANTTVTLTNNVTTTVTGAYVQPASVVVTLSPATGQWRIDGGAWRNSGTTASGLTPGAHTVSYNALTNYTAPATETVTLVGAQTTNVSRTYTATSSLTVTLTPSSGSWQVDGGASQASGGTVGGLTPGSHTINYGTAAGMLPPSSETVTLPAAQTTSISRSYTAEAGLIVNLTPNTAQWHVDGGPWQNSGVRVSQLTAGNHSVECGSVAGYQAPASSTVALVAGQTATVSRSYTAVSSLAVNLTPSSGSWQIDGGAWQSSGAAASDLTPGVHTIGYASVAGMLPLSPETVTLPAAQSTSLSRSYTAEAGIVVNLTPTTAQWRVDGGPWQNSSARVGQLTAGNHTVEYGSVTGYQAPSSSTVALVAGQTTTVSGSYTAVSNLTVNLTPATAMWRIDGGTWQNSDATIAGLTPGSHTVSYGAVAGMLPLSSETVTLAATQNTSISRSYIAEAGIVVNLTPASAQWRIDGGAWRNSGDRAGQLNAGNHSIEYNAAAGYATPSSETMTLVAGETTTIARTYTALATLTVTLTPSSAAWKVDGGSFRSSGTTATGLTPGDHTITYTGVSAMISPPTEVVSLPAGENTSLSRAYTPAGQIFVMLNPNTAQWRVDGGAWRATHTYTEWIAVGPHTLEYSAVPNKVTPALETVNVVASQVLQVSKNYANECGLIINLAPAVGQWRVDGGAWRYSSERVGQLVIGYHSVEYTAASGYSSPAPETVFLNTSGDTTIARSYLVSASLTVQVVPGEGQWRLRNGPWQASGATVTGLRPGDYAVEFSSVPGWFDIPSYSVTLAENETKTVSFQHVQHATATATLAPGSALWRLNGGAWQASGTTIGALNSGNYTIEYSAVTGMGTPPNETFTLAAGQQKSFVRSYSGASSLTINLSGGIGQWRVDGGAWQSPGSAVFDLSLGSHLVEYVAVSGYITPPSETLWFRLNQSLNLNRAYHDSASAYLEVKTIPAYLADQGIAKWRVDGGTWNAARTPAAVAPGTYTLEFQPVAGIETPTPSSVTVTAGAVKTVQATFHLQHRLRFFLHSDLVAGVSTADLQARLSQYAEHLQTIWHRESIRRLIFDPATDISVVTANPFSSNAFGTVPEYGFELWVYADAAGDSIFGSHNGYGGLDVSGAGGANGMHWTQIYDPAALLPGSTELYEYWKQIDTVTHEFEHTFGAGLGEYYTAGGFDDFTGVAPIFTVDYFTAEDPFWNAHADVWADPLLRSAWDNFRIGSPTSLPAVLDAVHFSAISRGIINGCYRNDGFAMDGGAALPDLTRVRVRVVDASTGQLIPGASLRIWNRPQPNGTSNEERTVLSTGTPGVFEFNWTPDPQETALNDWENGKLLKAFASGYQSKPQWEWVYDAQRVKTVDNLDEWEITVALEPAP
jgi:hypothetical protein